MTAEYDVKVPHNPYGKSIYADAFWEFYDSDHQNMKIEYDTVQEAVKASRSMYNIMCKNRIFDIIISRRKNVLYVIRSGKDDNHSEKVRMKNE